MAYRAPGPMPPRDLGPLVREHGPAARVPGNTNGGIAALVVLGATFFAAAAGLDLPIGFVAGAACIALGVGTALQRRSMQRVRVAVHEEGLDVVRGRAAYSAPWSAVASVTSADLHADIRGRHHHTVELSGGSKFVLTEWIDDIDALLDHVRRETEARLVPAARTRLAAGDRVSFGALTLTHAGVEADGKTAAFGEIDMILISAGSVQITRAADRGKAWCVVPLARVPNVHVLLALVREHAPTARVRT